MELSEKLSNFDYQNKCNTQSLRVSPEAPFDWKLLLIGPVRVKGIIKNVLYLEVGGSNSAPPTLFVIRIVLLHTEAVG